MDLPVVLLIIMFVVAMGALYLSFTADIFEQD